MTMRILLSEELTREAIAGCEQGKSPPLHDITLPFYRYVQGHADLLPHCSCRSEEVFPNVCVFGRQKLSHSGAEATPIPNKNRYSIKLVGWLARRRGRMSDTLAIIQS